MLFTNIPRHTRQNAITESDLEFWLVTVKVLNSYKIIIFGLIVTYIHNHEKCFFSSLQLSDA